ALIQRRILYGVTSLVLLFGIALVVARLFPALRWGRRKSKAADAEPEAVITYPAATGFTLLLMGVGLVLTLVPEFLYLRDNFGVRINTIFKFYYQTWLVFGVASAYGLYTILSDRGLRLPNSALRGVFASVAVIGIAIGLVYPALGLHNRMFIETGRANAEIQAPLTLDGGPSLTYASDYASIMCLRDLVGDEDDLVIAEAIGNAYNPNFGRVGALTGIPILLGWENHEGQWRGTTYGDVVGSRPQDIETLYTDLRWESAQGIIQTYGIDYVFYGNSERLTYGEAGEEKFRDSAEIVCERDGSAFYRVNSTVQVAAR
ncbi:MAG: hypothetical protein H7175_02450, partial [Burkholderiales bacterium]|nr:hypothetical protein [Anaerolineae bacterium]